MKPTQEQIDHLNAIQRSGQFHPFTCGGKRTDAAHLDGEGVLVATLDGWMCPYCDYRQPIRCDDPQNAVSPQIQPPSPPDGPSQEIARIREMANQYLAWYPESATSPIASPWANELLLLARIDELEAELALTKDTSTQ